MNSSLLDKILSGDEPLVVATVVGTEGHTYKKTAEKALYRPGDPISVWGNLGSQCVGQDIADRSRGVYQTGRPTTIHIDTSDPADAHIGYGVYCGGKLDVLLEPLTTGQREVYSELRRRLAAGHTCWLAHDTKSGELALSAEAPRPRNDLFVERVLPPRPLFLFGATPLAIEIVRVLGVMNFVVTVIDWRESYLGVVRDAGTNTLLARDHFPFDPDSIVIAISHNYEMDKAVVSAALRGGAAYVGLLSSTKRRDLLLDELGKEGLGRAVLGRIHSPVGIDVGATTDPGIAVSIVADLVRWEKR